MKVLSQDRNGNRNVMDIFFLVPRNNMQAKMAV